MSFNPNTSLIIMSESIASSESYLPCNEFQWSLEGPVSEIHYPHLHSGAPGIFSDLLRSVQMLKREWSAESIGKLPHLLFLVKRNLVPSFAVEDLPLGRTAAWMPDFAVKDLPLGRTLWWWSKLEGWRTVRVRLTCVFVYVSYLR